MIKAVMFDWGGVMVSGGRSFGKQLQYKAGVTLPDSNLQAFRKIRVALNRGQITEAEFETKFKELTGAKSIPLDFWLDESTIQILPEMKQFCEKLRTEGIKTGLISNMNKKLAEVISSAGGYDGFDPLLISYQLGISKPEPEIFDLALSKLKLQPNEIIFIDDLEDCLVYPRAIGMKTVLAKNSQQVIEEVSSLLG